MEHLQENQQQEGVHVVELRMLPLRAPAGENNATGDFSAATVPMKQHHSASELLPAAQPLQALPVPHLFQQSQLLLQHTKLMQFHPVTDGAAGPTPAAAALPGQYSFHPWNAQAAGHGGGGSVDMLRRQSPSNVNLCLPQQQQQQLLGGCGGAMTPSWPAASAGGVASAASLRRQAKADEFIAERLLSRQAAPTAEALRTFETAAATTAFPSRGWKKRVSSPDKSKKMDLEPSADDKDDEDETRPKPKRPLSAYNFFFQHERARLLIFSEGGGSLADHPPPANLRVEDVRRLLENNPYYTDRATRRHRKSHGRLSFAELVKHVSQSWKIVDDVTREAFEELANESKARYRKEIKEYKTRVQKRRKELSASIAAAIDEDDEIQEEKKNETKEDNNGSEKLTTTASSDSSSASHQEENSPTKRRRTHLQSRARRSSAPASMAAAVKAASKELLKEAVTLACIPDDAPSEVASSQEGFSDEDSSEASLQQSDEDLLDLFSHENEVGVASECDGIPRGRKVGRRLSFPTSAQAALVDSDLKDFLGELDWHKED